MATTPVEFRAPSGLTLTLELFAYGSDTVANTGGDSATEETNREGVYQASVTEALSGWYTAHILSGSTTLAVYDVYMVDDTSVHRCFDRSQDLAQETVGTCTTNSDMRGTDNAFLAASAPTNFGDLAITATTGKVTVGTNDDKTGYSIGGTITTLDALDTAQDTQHSTTQSAISALNDPTAAEIADAVWLETLADHSGTAGSTAEALNAAGAAGDPWTTALPGAYGAGSAGNIIGNLNDPTAAAIADAVLDEAMAGHVTAGSLGKYIADILEDTGTTIPGTLTTVEGKIDTIDGIVGNIIIDTAEIGAAGAGLTAVPWNASWDAEVQSEVTDALNAYDPPTRAELTSDIGTVTTAISGLENISATDVNTQVLDVINTDTLVAGQTIAEALRRIGTITSGTVSGAGTGTETFTDWAGSGNTLVITVDASGNRSGVTYN